MSKAVKKIVIVGGGTAGWLTAAIVAAQHKTDDNNGLQIVLVESSDIPTVFTRDLSKVVNLLIGCTATAIFIITPLLFLLAMGV